MTKRGALVTIGQSPRDDILAEMLPCWREGAIEVEQFGALDGLGHAEIERLAPLEAPRLVSRLADGREVALNAAAVKGRTVALVQTLVERGRHDIIVLLCTGAFEGLPLGPRPRPRPRPLVVESQRVMDHAVAALAPPSSRVGVLVPHAEQAASFAWALPNETVARHASPYGNGNGNGNSNRLEVAAQELARADVDLIALHCMGYGEADRARVAQSTGKPVLLARRLVGSAVAQIL